MLIFQPPIFFIPMTRHRYFLIALIPVLLLLAWHYLSPARQLKSAQEHFIKAIAEKDADACAKLIHADYTDQWTFTPADWPGILKDLRVLSPILEIHLLNPVYDAANGVVDTGLQAKSGGGPAADMIAARAVELKEPTRFIWKRQPWQPWSWRLVSIQNPLLEIPSDYRPGKLSGMPAL